MKIIKLLLILFGIFLLMKAFFILGFILILVGVVIFWARPRKNMML